MNVLLSGTFFGLFAFVIIGIDRKVRGLGRNGRPDGLVVGRDDRHQVSHATAPSPPPGASAATCEAGGEVAVDVDQRLQLGRIRIQLHVDGLFRHEDADVGDASLWAG